MSQPYSSSGSSEASDMHGLEEMKRRREELAAAREARRTLRLSSLSTPVQMSEEEKQDRFEAKMASISASSDQQKKEGTINTIRPTSVFSNMSEVERQRRYDEKMTSMGQGEIEINDQDAKQFLDSYENQSSKKPCTHPVSGLATMDNHLERKLSKNENAKWQQTEELAVAMAIHDDEEYQFGKDDKIIYAIAYDPDSQPPIFKNRRFQMYGVLLLIVFVIVGAGTGASISSLNTKQFQLEDVITDAPSVFVPLREKLMLEFLAKHVRTEKIYEENSPHRLAAQWMLYEDPLALQDLNDDFLQRYIMALLWYDSTNNGESPWRSCNPSFAQEDDDCTFLKWERLPNDEVCFEEVPKQKRWMSGADTCQWQGVECAKGTQVLGVDLFWQNMTGTLPTELSALSYLQQISVAYNQLEGSIPTEYANLRSLLNLEVHGNLLTGTIPEEFYLAGEEGRSKLVNFNVGDNLLSGMLDSRIGLLSDLKGLHFMQNGFVGPLPSEIGNLRYLSYSRGHGNQLTGTLPTELGLLRQINEFWYHQNAFEGGIPSELGNMKRMKDFRVYSNGLSQTIPEELYQMTNMKVLFIQDNEFTGTISTNIGNLKDLLALRVSENAFTGSIPDEIAQSQGLQVGWFHLNNLEGTMPSGICNLNLFGLQADCDPISSPAVHCDCCTSCCEQGKGLNSCLLRAGSPNFATLPPGFYDGYALCLDKDGNPR